MVSIRGICGRCNQSCLKRVCRIHLKERSSNKSKSNKRMKLKISLAITAISAMALSSFAQGGPGPGPGGPGGPGMGGPGRGAPVDWSKLPPPSDKKGVTYAADIKPL